jgi:hypothetical protein
MKLGVDEAGKLGGLTVLAKKGRIHFVEIGKKGQRVMRARYPNMASVWGKRGGRPKKLNLLEAGRTTLDSQKGG